MNLSTWIIDQACSAKMAAYWQSRKDQSPKDCQVPKLWTSLPITITSLQRFPNFKKKNKLLEFLAKKLLTRQSRAL